MYNPQDPFAPFTQLPADALNQMLDNIEAIHDGTGLADNSIEAGKLSFLSDLQTYTNPGSAGGTFGYINIGGLKLLFGITGNISTGSSGAVTYPVSFFSTVLMAIPSLYAASGTDTIYAPWLTSASAAGATINVKSASGSGSMPFQLFVIGT